MTLSIAIIAPTPNSVRLASRLQTVLPAAQIWTKITDRSYEEFPENFYTYRGSLSSLLPQLWQTCDRLIFILAVGAVVRAIAPFLNHKEEDPGVVAVDESGQFAVSVSGGHIGGADALARQIAAALEGTPVITSASEGYQLPAVDLLGNAYGWQRGSGDWLGVSSAIARRNPVLVVQQAGWDFWRGCLPPNHPFQFATEMDNMDDAEATAAIWIGDRLPPEAIRESPTNMPLVCWHPRTLWVGVGCERGTEVDLLEASLRQLLAENGLAVEAVAGLASIDIKADEPGLLELANRLNVPLQFYPRETLAKVDVPHPSAAVEQAVGTPSVSEAAALMAAGSSELAEIAIGKRVYRDARGACTLGIARSTVEYNPNIGQLYLIGSGPGSLDQITPAAKSAIAQADVVIGYKLYLDLIEPLLHPLQCREDSQITQEVERAERAIFLAKRGLTVAVISSGDCGIYGMAGLVMEALASQDWDGENPQVQVFPGITALQGVAAKVGAPLMHDFCAISLSNLLTPTDVIERRVEAAAMADFVVALYNPRSKNRTEVLTKALQIFRRYRSPKTPVAIARSIYRQDECIYLTTLDDIEEGQVDMLTVILIGNESTFRYRDRFITPRGYTGKYDF
jgi:cobalt-precorrin 5A hydrolase/precorrin-3B C17-methyltransferase